MSSNASQNFLLSFEYPPTSGGVSRLASEIARGLSKANLPVQVLTQDSTKTEGGLERPPNVAVKCVDPQRPLRELRALWELRGQSGPIISSIWYPEGLLATLLDIRPRVVLAHGLELLPTKQWWRRSLWRRLQGWVLESADLVVTNSAYTRQLVLDTAPDANVSAIPLAVDEKRFVPGDARAAKSEFGVADKIVLGSVSRITDRKGHDVVLRALARLAPTQRENLAYIVAGRGEHLVQLKELADELGVSDTVRWLGFVTEEELPQLYRAMDLFLLCSKEDRDAQFVEGFGLVFLEAQACQTAVLGTRTGGIPDAIAHGEGGWMIEQDDVDALRGFLERLIEAPEDFAEAGRVARQRVERECTWDHYIEHLQDVLTKNGIIPDVISPSTEAAQSSKAAGADAI